MNTNGALAPSIDKAVEIILEEQNGDNILYRGGLLNAIDFVNKNNKIPVEDMKMINFDKIKKRFRKSAVRYQSEPFGKSYKSQEIKGKFF